MRVWSDAQLKRMMMLRFLEIGALGLILAGCYIGYGRVKALEVAVAKDRLQIASRPQYLLHLSTLQSELRERGPDIDRVVALVADPQEIVQFIEEMENVARTHQVVLAVPSIDEVILRDAADQPVPERGPFRSIRLTISGEGRAEDLLEYVHKIEHGSRLVSLPEWSIAVDTRERSQAPAAAGAREIGEALASVAPQRPSTLHAEIILLVHNEKYSVQ